MDTKKNQKEKEEEEILKLNNEVKMLHNDNERLLFSKIELIKSTSEQFERMRDEISDLTEILQLLKRSSTIMETNRKHVKNNTNSNGIYIEEGLQNNNNNDEYKHDIIINDAFSFGRGKYSKPLWKDTVYDTQKSKIKLIENTSNEIERLRQIIRALSNQCEHK